MKRNLTHQRPGTSGLAILFTLCLAGTQAIAADYFHLGGANLRFDQAANYSNTNGSATAATVAPGATGTAFSDNLFFYNSLVAGPEIRTFELGAAQRNYNSLTFGSNVGTTQINRAATGSTNTHILGIGAGGITVDSGAGPITFGAGSGATGQRVDVAAFANYTIANNSSSDLTFFREFSGRGAAPFTVTVAGSGDGDTIFMNIRRYDAARDLAMTINTSGTGVVRFEGANQYSGGTTLQGGILGLRNSDALGSGALTINGGTLASTVIQRTITNNVTVGGDFSLGGLGSVITLNGTMDLGGATRTITLENSATVGGVISNGGLILTGAARSLTLNEANTYTGDTTVSSGTLIISSTGSLAATDITVDAGAVMEVAAGGSIANSPSILINGTLENVSTLTIGGGNLIGGNGTVSGSLDFASGALLAFDTDMTLTLDGTLTLDNTFGVGSLRNLSSGAIDWSTIANNSEGYTLLNTSFDFNESNISNFGSGNPYDIGEGRSAYFENGSLALVVIPEPGTLALVLISLSSILLFRRRK